MTPFWMKPLVEEVTGQPTGDPCFGSSAEIQDVSIATETAPTCSPSQAWEVTVSIQMTTGLEPDQEFKIYVAEDSAGTSYSLVARQTATNYTHAVGGQFFGTDGPGADHTKWAKAKVEVVPKNRDEVCDGPVESSQISRTEPLCTA